MATSVPVIAAVNCVALTKVVVLLTPFHLTISTFSKLDPVTVNVKAPDPAVLVEGEMDVFVGFGFTVTITSSLLLLTGASFQVKNWKKVPVPLFPVIDMLPLVIG